MDDLGRKLSRKKKEKNCQVGIWQNYYIGGMIRNSTKSTRDSQELAKIERKEKNRKN